MVTMERLSEILGSVEMSAVAFTDAVLDKKASTVFMGIEIPKEYMCITMDEDGRAYAHKVEPFTDNWFNSWHRTQARGWIRVPELDGYFKGDWKDSMIFFGA